MAQYLTKDLISQKLLINEGSIEVLKLQRKYSAILIALHRYNRVSAKKKILRITELNKLFNEQLNEFTDTRQHTILDLYKVINLEDEPKPRQTEYIEKLHSYKEQIDKLLVAIQEAEDAMPKEPVIAC